MMTNLSYTLQPSRSLSGTITVPGDKSISHRSIMLAALAEGSSQISGFLQGEDSLRTLEAFRHLGVVIDGPDNGVVTVNGVGLHGLQNPVSPLYLGNSGTSMRLMCGLLAAQSFDSCLQGDESLSKRPMQRVSIPLNEMGAKVVTQQHGYPPLMITGRQSLAAIDYALPVASAQIKSALLLAGLYANGTTTVREPGITRDHTERMLKAFSYRVAKQNGSVSLQGHGRLIATDIKVPADISSAAFYIVGASIAQDSEVLIKNVGINPTRAGVLDILKLMGADIELLNRDEDGFEPTADIRVRSAPLSGIEIPSEYVPIAIDEFPVIFIAAACASGQTVLKGAQELRVKESDRIQSMADGLTALGVDACSTEDGMVINGNTNQNSFQGGTIDSYGDHRIAMAFSMAALRCHQAIEIQNCENVNTSFPGFAALSKSIGLNIEQKAGARDR